MDGSLALNAGPFPDCGAALIKRIELFNFMSHEHSVLELAEGLTVLIGPNNCGKSSIITALQTVCQYESSKFMMRHGERESLVRLTTGEGDVVEWSRTKSGSPMYKINGQTFDRLNRSVPEQLHQVLRLPLVDCDDRIDVHFGEQKNPTFLLNDKPTAAAQFFASTSDASRLIEMQRLHRQRVGERKKDQTRLTAEKRELDTSLESLEPIDSIREQLGRVQAQYEILQSDEAQLNRLEVLLGRVTDMETRYVKLQQQFQTLEQIPGPPEVSETKSLEGLLGKASQLSRSVQWAAQVVDDLAELPAPPELTPTRPLTELVRELDIAKARKEKANWLAVVLDTLPSHVPGLQPEADLEKHVATQTAQEKTCALLQKRQRVMGQLNAPPELGEIQRASKWCARVESIEKESDQLKEKQAQIEELQTSVLEKMKSWYKENPTCPTCGQPATFEPWHPEHKHG